MSERFKIVTVNPNDVTGGGGCLCSETENPDTEGPFIVFEHQEMANNLSPHAVLCMRCARAAVLRGDREELAGGEPTPAVEGELVAEEDEPEFEI